MSSAIQLRGLAWDHRRCWGPLEASVSTYRALQPDIQVAWNRRSLWEFGEGRLDGPAADYDLVIYDHPFVGEVARDGLMLDLTRFLSADQITGFTNDSLGPSWQSYRFGGGIWALPIDGAAQVAAYRPDLLSRFADVPPRTLDQVFDLAESVRVAGMFIGWPSVPTDVMCTLLTIAAGLGHLPSRNAPFLPPRHFTEAMEPLRRLRSVAHPDGHRWNPIACYDHMSAADDVVYVPYGFGYVNYAAPDRDRRLAFTDIPGVDRAASGALLGGAGIGISARSANPRAAFDYAMFLCGRDYQSGDYVRHGGQPGSLAAWSDPDADAAVGGFFSATRQTLQNAYLRPTAPGFIDFFRQSAEWVSDHLANGDASGDARLADRLNLCFESCLADSEHAA